MKSRKKSKKFLAYLIPVILVAGSALGAGIWLMSAEVPVEYDEPYTVSMSQNETADDYEWNELQFRETTTTQTAYFNETGSGVLYHQYVRIENPTDGANVNVKADIEEPIGFDDQMGFTIMDGIVHPGEAEQVEVQQWGNISTGDTAVPADDTVNFTVIYTLSNDVPASDSYDVTWNFYEGESVTVSSGDSIQNSIDSVSGTVIFVEPGTYEENLTINVPDLVLFSTEGPEETIIEGTVDIGERDVTFDGFTVSPTTTFEGDTNKAAGIYVDSSEVTIENNIIEGIRGDASVDTENPMSIHGIQVYNVGDSITDIEISNNLIRDIDCDGDETEWPLYGGAVGIKIQNNITGVLVEYNTIEDIHSKGWVYGVVSTPSSTKTKQPKNVVVKRNQIQGLNNGTVYDVFTDESSAPYPGVAFGLDTAGGDPASGTPADASEVTLRYNNFETPVGVQNKDEDQPLDAGYNWWGDDTGPYNETENPDGEGAEAQGDVDFDPWLDSAVADAGKNW